MMATQTIEFGAPAGQTVTARLFAAGSDTVVATATATARTNATGIYIVAFTNLAPALYRLIGTNAAGTLLCQWWTLTAAATATYQAYEVPPSIIADQVWDEAYASHTNAGTFGKLMDTLRKANTVLEGTILASPTPTTTVFRLSGIDYPTGALTGSVLWMNSGASQEQNSPILITLNNGDGTVTVTLENALVTAPTAGDTVLIDPTSHVHSVVEIQAGLSTLTAAQVNAEVLDVLQTDLFGELAAVPGASSTLKDKIAFLFMLARNKVTQTSSTQTVFADNTTTPVAAATTSDVGGTFTRGEFA